MTKYRQSCFQRSNRVNINREITSNDLKTLIVPVRVDFIGKNQVPVAGIITVDFLRSGDFITNSFAKFVSLIHALDKDDEEGGKYYVLSREPKPNSGQHQYWEHMREARFTEFVDVNEIERVADYINKHDVRPLFSRED